ncbi:saccharopine dehydrogenase NADP-binding domain-containing protein [Acidovorax radicis]|uniref:saccharopine dehydrogenase NADP-binding domain-containing protein n=1 Tax=Acidovorax radicis TaxID=758826 RepID=UPI001CF7FED0|nr:saccharopine dehydrogenase NADP-binding domain-containing protein [Acidovorax radicis]UCU98187.1 saccharopine dehydrogenase NADP-binding domain-containing protein [Acidovorax radicis]
MATLKTLVLGGYGNFGARICRALVGDTATRHHTALLVAGRDAARAQALADTLGHGAQGVALNHQAPGLATTLRQWGVGLVIHTAGPFQVQGYSVAQAAAEAGAHYIDLADGRRFVCDFPAAMQAAFAAAGRTAIAGASTVPALSSAVIDHLCAGWQHIDSIDICIAPAQRAPRGQATLAAVLSYCGLPIDVWNGGRWQPQRGWAQPTPVRFQRLRPRLGAVCDIPDLEIFPAHYQARDRVTFRAALEVSLAQRAFATLAALRRWGVLPHPEKLAWLMHHAGGALDFLGTPLGGMVVRVAGADAQGQPRRRAWHIAADHDHGPEIPCMAAILLARQLAAGQALPIGAHTSTSLLPLAAFAAEFAKWGMVTDVVEE